jgi:integrase
MLFANAHSDSGSSDSPPFAPRLFAPDAGEPDEPQALTLRQAFDRYFAPNLTAPGRSLGTLSAYRNLVGLWEKFTADPRIGSITSALLADFRKRLEADEYAPATVAKLGRHLRALLRRLGPATDGNPQGLGILETVPYLESPRVGRSAPRTASLDEIDRLYDACRVAVWPHIPDVPAPAFWRALVCAFYNLGPRSWELLHDGSDERAGFLWANYQPYVRSATGTPLWSIAFLQRKTGNSLLLPVHPVLTAHLESVRTDRRAMFPVTLAHGSVYNQWRAIKSTAGVGVEGAPDLDFHDLRRTCQSEWDWLRLGLGDWILGHAPQDVGGRHYRNFARHAADACETLPQPKSFQTIFEKIVRERQTRLF